jgi:AbrB family looped-hinge helix DNA binding protein
MKYVIGNNTLFRCTNKMSKRTDLKAVLADRGQITIPKLLRDKLGLVPGTVVLFELRNGKIFLTKEATGDPVASVYGCLKGLAPYSATDKYMDEIRAPAE